MYFLVSKTIGGLLTPSTLLLVIGGVGVALTVTPLKRVGCQMAIVSAALLFISGFSPIGYWLLNPLESRFPQWQERNGKPDGIIVLGGSIDTELSSSRGFAVIPRAAERLIAAVELANRYSAIPVIYSGGSPNLFAPGAREADFVSEFFYKFGLSRDRLILEAESRNTIENAEFTRRYSKGGRWLLVTSAYHMPRAVGLFRTAGVAVEPYPVDWLTPGAASRSFWLDRPLYALQRTDLATREWAGLFVNWLLGKSNELLPSSI